MHRVEEIFSLRVDANAEFLAFISQTIFQLVVLSRARDVSAMITIANLP